jgi:hypothetical protein
MLLAIARDGPEPLSSAGESGSRSTAKVPLENFFFSTTGTRLAESLAVGEAFAIHPLKPERDTPSSAKTTKERAQ